MGTEHRWNERHTTDHSVLIKARPHGSQQARIRNVSTSGLFVELPPTTPLSNNTHVELIFVRSANQVSRILRLPALVVRTTASGAGLMFLDSSLMAFRTLFTQLLAEKKQAVRPARAMLEQVRLDGLQRLENAMVQSIDGNNSGLADSVPAEQQPKPYLPESGPH